MVQISDVTVYDVHAGNDFKKMVSPNESSSEPSVYPNALFSRLYSLVPKYPRLF